MERTYLDRRTIEEFLTRLAAAFDRPGRLDLVGETTQAYEGWRERTTRLEFAADIASGQRFAFAEAVRRLRVQMGIEILQESPGDVIPLPTGHAARARFVGQIGDLRVYHFDPYSVTFRLIARGDEPDYHAVIAFLQHGWLTVDELNALLADLLPQFTSETIQQDPAEFRRKFKGLLQMWRAAQPREREASG
jgi:hypothetical protein